MIPYHGNVLFKTSFQIFKILPEQLHSLVFHSLHWSNTVKYGKTAKNVGAGAFPPCCCLMVAMQCHQMYGCEWNKKTHLPRCCLAVAMHCIALQCSATALTDSLNVLISELCIPKQINTTWPTFLTYQPKLTNFLIFLMKLYTFDQNLQFRQNITISTKFHDLGQSS